MAVLGWSEGLSVKERGMGPAVFLERDGVVNRAVTRDRPFDVKTLKQAVMG